MSKQSIIHEINKMDDLKELEEILMACRKVVQSVKQQGYENAVSSLWDSFTKKYKRGDSLRVKKIEGFSGGDLKIYNIGKEDVTVKDVKTGKEFVLSKERLYKYSLFEIELDLEESSE